MHEMGSGGICELACTGLNAHSREREVRQSGLRLKARQLRSLGNIKRIIHASPQVRSASDPSHPLDTLNPTRSATPGVTEGARYSFSPSCPLETEQKAGVRNGKPRLSVEEPMLSTGLHLASESTTQGAEAFDTACRERCLIPGFCEARGLIFARPLAISNRLDTMLLKEQPGTPRPRLEIQLLYVEKMQYEYELEREPRSILQVPRR